MGNQGFLKRMLPFVGTFAIGIFVASFFVGFDGPRFRGRGWERRMEFQRMRCENERLREENMRLHAELNELRVQSSDQANNEIFLSDDTDRPPPPPKKESLPKHDK